MNEDPFAAEFENKNEPDQKKKNESFEEIKMTSNAK